MNLLYFQEDVFYFLLWKYDKICKSVCPVPQDPTPFLPQFLPTPVHAPSPLAPTPAPSSSRTPSGLRLGVPLWTFGAGDQEAGVT